MNNHLSNVVRRPTGQATPVFRRLLDELRMLTLSLPDLRDAFGPDELPFAFLLKRDSRVTEVSSDQRMSAVCRRNSAYRRTPSRRPRRRSGRRKQMSHHS